MSKPPPADTSTAIASPVPFATTIHVRDTCLCLHAQRAARALARHFDRALAPLGLTSGQFSLLMALNRPTPPDIAETAALLAMDRTTLTAALKPLERRALVEILCSATDRRRRDLVLTQAGRSLLGAALPIWQREHAALESRLAEPARTRADLSTLSRPPEHRH